jgi:hypothetical protein
MLVTVTTAGSATSAQVNRFFQRIEGNNIAHLNFGTANASTVTLSFWVRSSLTGTYCAALVNNAANRAYVAEYSISAANTWEYKTITIAGDTTGTWETGASSGIQVTFDLGSGSDYNATAGSWVAANDFRTTNQANFANTSGATFYITGVQLELGSVATKFEHCSYGDELALCRRYYEVTAENQEIYGVCSYFDTTNAYGEWKFIVEKRANPTLGLLQGGYTNLRFRYAGLDYTLNAGAGWSASGITTQNARHNVYTSPSTGTVGQSGWLSHSSGTTQFYADAEL